MKLTFVLDCLVSIVALEWLQSKVGVVGRRADPHLSRASGSLRRLLWPAQTVSCRNNCSDTGWCGYSTQRYVRHPSAEPYEKFPLTLKGTSIGLSRLSQTWLRDARQMQSKQNTDGSGEVWDGVSRLEVEDRV